MAPTQLTNDLRVRLTSRSRCPTKDIEESFKRSPTAVVQSSLSLPFWTVQSVVRLKQLKPLYSRSWDGALNLSDIHNMLYSLIVDRVSCLHERVPQKQSNCARWLPQIIVNTYFSTKLLGNFPRTAEAFQLGHETGWSSANKTRTS